MISNASKRIATTLHQMYLMGKKTARIFTEFIHGERKKKRLFLKKGKIILYDIYISDQQHRSMNSLFSCTG